MSNKDMIGQEVVCYEAVGKISKLLDQIGEGLRTLEVIRVMRRFPELFVPLFTYTASISAEEVLDAVHADENMMPEDRVTMAHLNRWISEASVESKYFGKSKSGRYAFQKCTVQTLSALWMCSLIPTYQAS